MWKLDSGESVTDRPNTHMSQDVQEVLPEALSRTRSNGRSFIEEQVDFDRVVGKRICVRTTATDDIVWAKRPKRSGFSRFVRNREPEPTTSMVVILKKAAYKGGYVLITAYFGQKAGPEPWDRHATESSRKFWKEHALVWGSMPVVEGTVTDHDPSAHEAAPAEVKGAPQIARVVRVGILSGDADRRFR